MEKIFTIETEIYNEEVLKNAISDFSENFKISLEGNFLKIFGENEIEIDEIFNELMNYYIWLANQ